MNWITLIVLHCISFQFIELFFRTLHFTQLYQSKQNLPCPLQSDLQLAARKSMNCFQWSDTSIYIILLPCISCNFNNKKLQYGPQMELMTQQNIFSFKAYQSPDNLTQPLVAMVMTLFMSTQMFSFMIHPLKILSRLNQYSFFFQTQDVITEKKIVKFREVALTV